MGVTCGVGKVGKVDRTLLKGRTSAEGKESTDMPCVADCVIPGFAEPAIIYVLQGYRQLVLLGLQFQEFVTKRYPAGHKTGPSTTVLGLRESRFQLQRR